MKWQVIACNDQYVDYDCGACHHMLRVYDADPYVILDVDKCPTCGAKFEPDEMVSV